MARLAFVSFFLSIIAAIALAEDLSSVITPVTRALHNDEVHSAVRAAMKSATRSSEKGSIQGGYESNFGAGKFSGAFRAKTQGNVSDVEFNFSASGKIKQQTAQAAYNIKLSGDLDIHDKDLVLKSKYKWNLFNGTVNGASFKGSGEGDFTFRVFGKQVEAVERGTMSLSIAGKKLNARYLIETSTDKVSTHVYGKLGGEKFFMSYTVSTNIAALGVETSPTEITRIFGTVTLEKNGKKVTEKFDVKGLDKALTSI